MPVNLVPSTKRETLASFQIYICIVKRQLYKVKIVMICMKQALEVNPEPCYRLYWVTVINNSQQREPQRTTNKYLMV